MSYARGGRMGGDPAAEGRTVQWEDTVRDPRRQGLNELPEQAGDLAQRAAVLLRDDGTV